MRIVTFTILTLTPVFAVLGCLIGWLVYSSERAELIWSAEQERSSWAISIAEFIPISDSPPPQLESVLRHGQLKSVRLTDLEKQTLWESGDLAFLQPELQASSTATVTNADGQPVGMLTAATDPAKFSSPLRSLWRRCLLLALALTGAGVCVSAALGAFLSRRIGRLNRAVGIIGSGDFEHRIAPTGIAEVTDLGSSFNTMSSILQDEINRGKMSLVEAEQFRAPSDLAKACHLWNPQRERCEIHGRKILFRLAGSKPSGHFGGIVDDRYLILGHIQDEDPLDAEIRANATLTFLRRTLAKQDPAAALALAAAAGFDLENCAIFTMESPTHLQSHQLPGQEVWPNQLELPAGKAQVISTAPADQFHRLERFLNAAGDIAREEIDQLFTDAGFAPVFIIF